MFFKFRALSTLPCPFISSIVYSFGFIFIYFKPEKELLFELTLFITFVFTSFV